MNKKELIGKYKYLNHNFFRRVDTSEVLRDLKQLDEPEKIVIPQFVANWIEEAKKSCKDVSDLFDFDFTNEEVGNWFLQEKPFDLVARAWLDGYEVEKEPKYTVKFKATNQYLCDDDGIGLHISPSFRSNFRKSDLEKLSLTEVFNSTLFEVEEVTE